ncbi:carbamoyltransferase [Amycolatopsis sp. NPDC049868]|uniref:carbamoyltransferase n=1 Tax=Amycolatopsis sp. NPDC049868 TaxID=3363934 RepID=UPI0037B68BEB
MLVLGVSAGYHDAAAAVASSGTVVAAAQEERFSRVKNDSRFPRGAIRAVLREAGVQPGDVDVVAFYEKPLLKLARVLENGRRHYPSATDLTSEALRRTRHTLLPETTLRWQLGEVLRPRLGRAWDGELAYVTHHRSHAASAFYPSPYRNAAILTIDGVGEFATTSISSGVTEDSGRRRIEAIAEQRYPHSLGLLYSAFTHFLGFEVNEGEYKVMGLAPYGEPRLASVIRDELIEVSDDGVVVINTDILTYAVRRQMYNPAEMTRVLGIGPRTKTDPLTQAHADIAASLQEVTEDAIFALAAEAQRRTQSSHLVMAGGVALNCVANGKLLRSGMFDGLWIQPAAGDAGGAIGAALEVCHRREITPARTYGTDQMSGSRLGPAFDSSRIERAVAASGLPSTTASRAATIGLAAAVLAGGGVVGWFQGRMEFGPRALGGRSILANPATERMQSTLNRRVKGRESFRPFSAMILQEDLADWFRLRRQDDDEDPSAETVESPYMLLVGAALMKHRLDSRQVPSRRLTIPPPPTTTVAACTHVDASVRIQTVGPRDDLLLHDLLQEFKRLTGLPLLVNTSFNRSSEPIVCTPEDALDCFAATGMDVLCLGTTVVWKPDTPTTVSAVIASFSQEVQV